MGEDGEAGGFEAVEAAGQEQRVLEDASGEGHCRQGVLGAEGFADGEDGGGEGVVEAGGKDGDGDAGQQIVGQGSHEHADAELAIHVRHGVGAGLGRVGGVFEFDGGLAFVGHRIADPKEGRDGVEEAAGGRREGCEIGAGQGQDSVPVVRMTLDDGEFGRDGAGVGGVQVRQGHAPGRLDGGVGAGHGDLGEVGGALERNQISEEELAAPRVLIAAEPEAVEGHSNRRARNTVIHQARGDVGVVVLHPDEARGEPLGELGRVDGRGVVGVQIVGDDGGGDVQKVNEMSDSVNVGLERLVVLEVTDVVGDEGVPAAGDTERVLQAGAHRRARPPKTRRASQSARARSPASGGAG